MMDPGSAQQAREVSYLWFVTFGFVTVTFISTVLQVWRAKENLKSMLLRMNEGELRYKIGPREILEDIKKDKEMKRSLLDHMEKELSSEILQFILRVDEWKKFIADPKNDEVSPGKNQRAREIYDEFIRSGAINEVNLPSTMKEDLWNVFAGSGSNGIVASVFDKAQNEATDLLIKDSLPRFVSKHAKLWVHRKKSVYSLKDKGSSNKSSERENSPTASVYDIEAYSTIGNSLS